MSDPRDNRLDYVELPATDIQASKQFFINLFGWTFEDWGDAYISFSDGRMTGGFYSAEVSSSREAGSALIVMYHSDLESTRDRVVELGGAIVKDIFSFPGGRRFHFVDPSGNEFAVWSEPE